ncbi:LA_2272/LA_2273 family lipoprotein [Leptospira santarosai]|nr:hypothetical protein [Leptospira santarosai]
MTAKIPPETETEVFRLNLLYGEVDNLYGFNVGLYNHIDEMIGAQIGILNTVHDPIGIQIGAINGVIAVHDIQTGLKIGFFNFGFILESNNPVDYLPKYRKISASVGLVNMMNGKLKLGLFNMGNGINLGIVNLHSDDRWTVSIGAVNIGKYGNHLQIGIVNYCPNNTIPVMISELLFQALSAKAKNQLGNTAERGDRIKKTSRINHSTTDKGRSFKN